MFSYKTLYTTIMYQVKFLLILFLVSFFNINAVYSQTISPKDEIAQNYWNFVEPVLRCQATHEYMIQSSLDYAYFLGFFRNLDPNGNNTVTEFLDMTKTEVIWLETIKDRLKEVAVPQDEYSLEDRANIIKEMKAIEKEQHVKYYIEWFQSRSVSDVGVFHNNLRQTIGWCIQQRQKWNNTLDMNSL